MLAERDRPVRAACAGHDPDLWYALPGSSEEADAISVCGMCPVAEPCRRYARQEREPWGIWGGETAEVRLGRTVLAEPGTVVACEQCRCAYRRRRRGQRFCSHRCHHAAMARDAGTARRADCGSTGAARRHRKRGEPMDDACRMAESLYRAQLRARTREAVSV